MEPVADLLLDPLALGGQRGDRLAGALGGGDLPVKRLLVELQALELERGRVGGEVARRGSPARRPAARGRPRRRQPLARDARGARRGSARRGASDRSRTTRRCPSPRARGGPASLTARQRARNARSVSSRRSTEVTTCAAVSTAPRRAAVRSRGARRSASLVIASGICSRLATSWIRSYWSGPGSSRPTIGATARSASSRPSGVSSSPASSARSTSKRATGTEASSSARIAAAPSPLHDVGGVPPGRQPHDAQVEAAQARRSLNTRIASLPLATASCPAASGSWQSSTLGVSRLSASSWRSVSAVPIEQTVSGMPAWRSAITSV